MLALIVLWWLIYVPIERFLCWCNAAVSIGGLLAERLCDNGCYSIQHLVSVPPRGWNIPFAVGSLIRRRTLKSTLHPTIFCEMVKFVDLGVLYMSLVLPQ